MAEQPSGTVTFLFTDVEGSTASWEKRPEAMPAAMALHDEILRSAIAAAGGTVFSTGGDGFAAVFGRAASAVAAAVEGQAALARVAWGDGLRLRVRMGLHTGEAHERGGDYFGSAVNRAARVMDAANGSQILLSGATRAVMAGDMSSVTLVDLGVHELRDVADPVRLYRVDAGAFESDQRPPRSGIVRAGNLPSPPGLLVGRTEDVEAVLEDLRLARVVTLTGVGGIGKTRLALEVGRQVQPSWPDGVWFASLETATRPDEMVRSLLSLLSIEPGRGSDLDALVEGLRVRSALLILDNCEHLLDAVAEVVTNIAARCPEVRVLATSREPLDIDGERSRRVRPLPSGEGGAALELFWLRAVEAGADLEPERDSDAVTRICQRLDGIPLAIELAAARSRSLRVPEVADRLDDMFRLLTGGRRTSTDRHRTLRATLEWSHSLLDEEEQAVLAGLSTFAGSFTLAAAEAVAGGGGDFDTLEVLDRLVRRSLVVPVEVGDESRFRLLEPVRQFAAEKLMARGEADDARERHTSWCVGLMADLADRWRSGDDQGTWPIAARELPDLRVAFDHLVETGRADDAQRFAVDSFVVIGCHFDVVPMYDWAPRALQITAGQIGAFTAAACAVAAWGAIPMGDLDAAAAWLRLGVDAVTAGSRDDGLLAAAAMHHVLSGGELAVTDEFLARSLADALRSDDLHRQVWVLTYAGRFAEGRSHAEQLGNKFLVALALSWVAALSTEGRDEAREEFWDAAQDSHSYLMRNHASMELAIEQIRTGAPLDGLLLLRAPARDWLLRGDARVWSVLHAMAIGFATIGEREFAERLDAAIGDRSLPFVSSRRRALLRELLPEIVHRRTARADAGRLRDAAAAVSEALERIEALRARPPDDHPRMSEDGLTARQLEIAELVARGLTNKQIAQRLAISRFTAETHVRNILERLGAASRSEIATWFTRRSNLERGARAGS